MIEPILWVFFVYRKRINVAKNIQAIRGMNDYLPGETAIWQRIEGTLKNVLGSYGYSEIRLPIVEQTPLFKRAIGEVTDVVEKEMYTFEDRNGDSLTLRAMRQPVRGLSDVMSIKASHRFFIFIYC